MLWLLGFLFTHPAVSAPFDPCQQIATVYNACGERFRFDGRQFEFSYAGRVERMACEDGLRLSYFDRLDHMDIASIFLYPYVAGPVTLPEIRQNWDPGRLRAEPLLKTLYGADEGAVRAELVPVNFLGQTILFQRRLGAAKALERVGAELLAAAKSDRSLAEFLAPFTSKKIDLRLYGFYWRFVKGTKRLSSHAFGTGIDLLTGNGPQYWLWDEQKLHPDWAAQGENAYREIHYIPRAAPQFHAAAVAIFERNGFIWGGKWNHYDTMHFEYRPEFSASRVECAEEPSVSPLFLSEPMPEGIEVSH